MLQRMNLFPREQKSITLDKHPILVRLGEYGPIVSGYTGLNEPFGIINYDLNLLPEAYDDVYSALELDIIKPYLWQAAAKYPFTAMFYGRTPSMLLTMYTDGITVYSYSNKDVTYTAEHSISGLKQFLSMKRVGFVVTRPEFLDPHIYPYYLYVDDDNWVYTGYDKWKLPFTPNELPDGNVLHYYKECIDANADFVVLHDGVPVFYKNGKEV